MNVSSKSSGTPNTSGVHLLSPDRPRNISEIACSFENLSMVYPDGTEALRNINLDIHKGEFVSVIGPSGCGKSTLARIASGLLAQTEGTLRIDREQLAFTFQEATLLPWRKVLGNVELLMELKGIPAAERRRKALEQIEMVGLKGFEDRYPRALSGGMRMRASLARSFSLDPDVFLFDEPFGALDEITRERLIEELSTLHRRDGFTGMFITHSIPEAIYLSTRVVVMSARPGEIAAEYAINLPQPRTAQMRFDPLFTQGCADLSHKLRSVIEDAAAGENK